MTPLARLSLLTLSLVATSQSAIADEVGTLPRDTATPPHVDPAAETRGYVGIGTGKTLFGYDSEKCSRDLGTPCDIDSTDGSVKVYAGLNLSPNGGVELTYYDLGTLEGTVAGVNVIEEQTSVSLALVGSSQFNDQLAGFLKFGVHNTKLTATGYGPGGTATFSDTATSVLFGVGLSVNFSAHAGVRIEYERLAEAGDTASDVSIASASLRLMF